MNLAKRWIGFNMVYIIGVIIAIVTSLMVLTLKYESNPGAMQNGLARVEIMMSNIDDSVNQYIENTKTLDDINFEQLHEEHYLLSNSIIYGNLFASTMMFHGNNIVWHLIPNKDDETSYKLLIDFRQDVALMEKPIFSESFIGTEYCEKLLFANVSPLINRYDDVALDFTSSNGTKTDGILECTVYKQF